MAVEQKQIDIKDQPRLSFGRVVQITLNGIRYRLFRSSVTVVVVAVAIAFLMNVLSESLAKRAVVEHTQERILEMRKAAAWASKLSNVGTQEEILLKLAHSSEGDEAYRESAQLGGLSEQQMKTFHQNATTAVQFLDFFNSLKYGRRRSLVHQATGVDIFDQLQAPDNWDRFTRGLKQMTSVRFNYDLEEFKTFLTHWPEIKSTIQKVLQGRKKAIEKIESLMNEQTMMVALSEADGEFGDTILESGFVLDPDTAEKVAVQARRMRDMNIVEKTISNKEVRGKVAGYLDITAGQVNSEKLWKLLRNENSARWYFSKLQELEVRPEGVDLARAMELAELEFEERALNRADLQVVDEQGGAFGLGERMSWLIFASMLVCIVGISNAMLMSVTERFREIATLKCLGGLDGFIMVTFVMEACCLGVVGAFLGAIAGSILGLLRMLMVFRGLLFPSIPYSDLFIAVLFSMALGVILAGLASVYPSLKAARLAPMEAMRIE